MKKLMFLIAMLTSLVTFADFRSVPVWDSGLYSKPNVIDLHKFKQPFGKPAFDDPYPVWEFTQQIGEWWQSNYALQFQVEMDHSVPVKWYVTFQVLGNWAGSTDNYKEFQLILNQGQYMKTQTFPLNSADRPAWTAWSVIIDAGPY